MTRDEAIERLNIHKSTSVFVDSIAEAIDIAIEALSADAVHGEWIFNPTDAIDLMFAKPKCSKCGFESSDGGNFCPNCGARMKGGAE